MPRLTANFASIGLAAIILAVRSAAAAPTPDSSPDTVLATVDGDPVTTRDLRVLLAQQRPPQSADAASGVSADGTLKRLIQNRLLEHEGYRMGLDESPAIQAQVWDVVRHRAMMALLDSVSAPVREATPEQSVEAAPVTSRMFRVSHILVETEAEARALLDSLGTGTSFGALAERHSLDEEWSAPDGDLGWAREDKFIPEFIEVLNGLSLGGVGGPVKTEKGWHLLRLSEIHTETLPQEGAMHDAAQTAETRRKVMEVVRAYVDSLREKYAVTTNDSLLATLDYGSEDPEVLRNLRDSEEVLARLPWAELTVRSFSRQIRFEHFHGLSGKEDAPAIRDRAFEEWITEMLLRHEAVELGFDRKPDIQAAAQEMEREKLREAVGEMILDVRFEPDDGQVERYYQEHRHRFTPPPGVRATGVLLSGAEAARRFRQRLDAGAQLGWLAERTPEVIDSAPALFSDWMHPSALGLDEVPKEIGQLVGPFEVEGAWAVARIADVQQLPPRPLEECRAQVVALMKSDRMRDTMNESLARLEQAAEIEVADGAKDVVQEHVDRWLGPVSRAIVDRRERSGRASLDAGKEDAP